MNITFLTFLDRIDVDFDFEVDLADADVEVDDFPFEQKERIGMRKEWR
jgi:hypothetical protein